MLLEIWPRPNGLEAPGIILLDRQQIHESLHSTDQCNSQYSFIREARWLRLTMCQRTEGKCLWTVPLKMRHQCHTPFLQDSENISKVGGRKIVRVRSHWGETASSVHDRTILLTNSRQLWL